jgi:hypothetical protein
LTAGLGLVRYAVVGIETRTFFFSDARLAALKQQVTDTYTRPHPTPLEARRGDPTSSCPLPVPASP